MLEAVFPSLRVETDAPRNGRDLPTLTFPPNYQIIVEDTVAGINAAAQLFLDMLSDDQSHIVLGFDTEWSVDFAARQPKPTATIQIALNTRAVIFRLRNLTALPAVLLTLLRSEQVWKVGRTIKGDLSKLSRDYAPDSEFRGAVDVARMAKDRGLIWHAGRSLQKVVAAVLHRSLAKPAETRIGQWDAPGSSQRQIDYAAVDALAGLLVFDKLGQLPSLAESQSKIQPGDKVAITIPGSHRFVAKGVIQEPLADRATRSTSHIVRLTRVLVPATILPRQSRPLGEVGDDILSIPKSLIILEQYSQALRSDDSSLANLAPSIQEASTDSVRDSDLAAVTVDPLGDFDSESDSSSNSDFDDAPDPKIEHEIPPAQYAAAESRPFLPQFNNQITRPLRVLKDAWHIKLSKKHAMHHDFQLAHTAAIFRFDKSDKEAVIRVLSVRFGMTWEESVGAFVLRRVR